MSADTGPSLREFLRHGRVGGVRIGTALSDVIRELGAPDDVSVERLPKILKYGNVQFTFSGESLVGVAIGTNPADPQWHAALVSMEQPGLRAMPETLFVGQFADCVEGFLEDEATSYEGQRVLVLVPSRVRALFADGKLDRLFISQRASHASPR